MPSQKSEHSESANQDLVRNRWWLWLGFLGLACTVHLGTIRISPTIWQDEVQIVDSGRATLASPATTWAITLGSDNRPFTFLTFVGPVVQEAAFQAFFPSPVGPRLSGILGALVAAWGMLALLRRRGVHDAMAMVLAGTFFLDPLFVQGYKGARVDGWAMAAVLWACVFVGRAAGEQGWRRVLEGSAAGALAALGCMTWASAALLGLLMVDEWRASTRSIDAPTALGRRRAAIASSVAAGFLATMLLLAAIYVALRGNPFSQPRAEVSNVVTQSFASIAKGVGESVRVSPWIWILAGASVVVARQWLLGSLALIAAVVAIGTHSYQHRIVYLLPYAFALIGAAAAFPPERLPRWWKAGLALAGVWAVGVSLVARPVRAWSERQVRDPDIVSTFASASMGDGALDVFVEPWEFYYSGRSLGWRMGGALPSEQRRKVLGDMDHAIVYAKGKTSIDADLATCGFAMRGGVQGERPAVQASRGYGDYRVFDRTGPPSIDCR